jgi:hypothetical protein
MERDRRRRPKIKSKRGLAPYDVEFRKKMEKVEEIVEKYRNTLRALANKSRNVEKSGGSYVWSIRRW